MASPSRKIFCQVSSRQRSGQIVVKGNSNSIGLSMTVLRIPIAGIGAYFAVACLARSMTRPSGKDRRIGGAAKIANPPPIIAAYHGTEFQILASPIKKQAHAPAIDPYRITVPEALLREAGRCSWGKCPLAART